MPEQDSDFLWKLLWGVRTFHSFFLGSSYGCPCEMAECAEDDHVQVHFDIGETHFPSMCHDGHMIDEMM